MKSLEKALCLLCVLCGASFCFSLNREAFSITNYDLNLQIEPEQHRLGVRGKITLRNDTSAPQKFAVLQISSSLDWRAIRAGDKMLQFVTQPYTSDIDHTGSLSEAIVTLPNEVGPKQSVDINVAYEGVVTLDPTRLTRIGTPEDAARDADWDEISSAFTAIRGAGYVAWYPIATEAANLSEANSLFDTLGRWKSREAAARMHLQFAIPQSDEPTQELVVTRATCPTVRPSPGHDLIADCSYQNPGGGGPAIVIANYQVVERPHITVHCIAAHNLAATEFADAAEKLVPLITDWFGAMKEKALTLDLANSQSGSFEDEFVLIRPLDHAKSKLLGLAATHQLAHASLSSPRPWIDEGLAHFAQALSVENQNGRQAALDYMAAHRSILTTIESAEATPHPEDDVSHSLVNSVNEQLYRSKAMCVWWMLRDMIGDAALKKAIASYQPEQDNDPGYMPRLIAAQTQRELSWFFDDWLYHDRSLPDFKVESAYAASTPTKSFLLTVTLDNLGTAGAEVPVIIKFATGEITKRVEVRAKSKITFRVETPTPPKEIRVNDGSIPESDLTNNSFTLQQPPK